MNENNKETKEKAEAEAELDLVPDFKMNNELHSQNQPVPVSP